MAESTKAKPAKQEMTELERTAYDEAGHAVAAFILHRGYKYVTVVPRGDRLGHARHTKLADDFWERFNNATVGNARRFEIAETEALICLAGGAAVEMMFGTIPNDKKWQADREAAQHIISIIGGGDEKYFTRLWLRIKEELQVPWNWVMVEQLAKQLIEKHALSSREARQVMARARDDYFVKRAQVHLAA